MKKRNDRRANLLALRDIHVASSAVFLRRFEHD
jgi:hypothetical protein